MSAKLSINITIEPQSFTSKTKLLGVSKKPTSYVTPNNFKPSILGLKHKELKWVSEKRRVLSMSNEGGGLTYKDAGVDIDAGAELVKRISKMAPGIGGFGGLFPLGTSFSCSRF